MIFLRRLVLALLPVAMLGLYAKRPELAFLPWIALVPWVVLYTDDRQGKVSSLWYVGAALLSWVAEYAPFFDYGWYSPLIMSLFLGLMRIPFAPLLSRIHHRFLLPRTLTVPLIWVAVELLRATFTLSHMDLFRLGYSQARFPILVQFADITGAYGVSFLVAMVNGLIADLWFALRHTGFSVKQSLRSRRLVVSVVSVAMVFLVVTGYGLIRSSGIELKDGPRVALVQPNVAHTMRNLVGVHLLQLLMTEENVPENDVDLIVWPENAIMDNLERRGIYLDDLSWMARRKNARILVGALGDSPDRPGYSMNGAFLVNGEGEIEDSYFKQMLFPWSEFVPADDFTRKFLPALFRAHRLLTRTAWGFMPTGLPGDETVVMDLKVGDGTIPFTSLICIENCYPPLAAEAGKMGARFYVNITSEGEVGGSVQEQLLRIAIMRAIENRMSYVRCGNTGISGIIDPLGKVIGILTAENGQAISVPGVFIGTVPVSTGRRTAYSMSRDLFAKVVLSITALLWIASFFRRPGRGGAMPGTVALLSLVLLQAGCGGGASLGSDPGVVQDRIEAGNRAVREGRPADAIPLFQDACATAAGCERVLEPIGFCFHSVRKIEEGADFFKLVAETYPEVAAPALAQAARFMEQGLFLEEARESYERSLTMEASPEVYRRLGTLLLRFGAVEESLAAYRSGLLEDPEDPRLQYSLAQALRQLGDLDEARVIVERLLEGEGNNANAWAFLGQILYEQGQEEGSRRALETSLGLDSGNIQARFLMARYALRGGDLELFRRHLDRIVQVEETLGRGPRQED